MSTDDVPVGRLLTRREILLLLGSAGAFSLVRSANAGPPRSTSGVCVARPEQTEGPYFVDDRLRRSDVRSDPANGEISGGVPLALTMIVSRLDGAECRPLPGAHVDVWQCDAFGVYSDVRDPQFDTLGRKFLRGYQLTDDSGEARFLTIYPGWYRGRTVHIHFKIRTDPSASQGYEFTSQLYFDDAFTDHVFTSPPYSSREGRRTRNPEDRIYNRGGDQLVLEPVPEGDGYAARFMIALQGF